MQGGLRGSALELKSSNQSLLPTSRGKSSPELWPCLNWAPLEADLGTRIGVHIVYLGAWTGRGVEKRYGEVKTAHDGSIISPATSRSTWNLFPPVLTINLRMILAKRRGSCAFMPLYLSIIKGCPGEWGQRGRRGGKCWLLGTSTQFVGQCGFWHPEAGFWQRCGCYPWEVRLGTGKV